MIAEANELIPRDDDDSNANWLDRYTLTKKQRRYLTAYVTWRRLRTAADFANCHHLNHYGWLKKSEDYRQAFAEAELLVLAAVEDEVYRRGVEGVMMPLSSKGKLTGDYIRQYSDNLLMFLAKGLAPEKYRDNYNVQVNNSGEVKHNHDVIVGVGTIEQRTAFVQAQLIAELAKRGITVDASGLGSGTGNSGSQVLPDLPNGATT